jgi:hypothetical protein
MDTLPFDVQRLIRSQVRLARSRGAGAGAVTTASEMSSIVDGPVAIGTTVLTILADLSSLSVDPDPAEP